MVSTKISGREKHSKLEGMGVYLRYSPLFLVNEVLQQIKCVYYHVKKIEHERVPLDSVNPDTYFDLLSVYVRKGSVPDLSLH